MESTVESSVLGADQSTTNQLLKTLIDQSTCSICHELMYVPVMSKCGHNFCYSCITQWLSSSVTCPTCRSEVMEPPYINWSLQNIVKSLVNTHKTIAGTGANQILNEMSSSLRAYKRDVDKNTLYKNIFKYSGTALIDSSDGVARCSNCHWEVDGSVCANCHTRLTNPYINEISSAHTSDLDMGQDIAFSSDELDSDEEGENDSFIADDDEIILEDDVDDGLLDSSDSSPVRRHNTYRPTILDNSAWEDDLDDDDSSNYEEWVGFSPSHNRIRRSQENIGSVPRITLDPSDEEDEEDFGHELEVGPSVEELRSSDLSDMDSDHSLDYHVNKRRRAHILSESEDEEEDE